MSLSVVENPDNENDCEKIRKALIEASSKGIAVFCSQRDGEQGPTRSVMNGTAGLISIGAATAFGKQARYVPTGANFILPGHQVVLPDPVSNISTIESGSSISTALAAGLAALILRCAAIILPYSKAPEPPNFLDRLKLRKNMKPIFTNMADGGNNYVHVTTRFRKYEGCSIADQVDKIRLMLSDIMSKTN